MLQRASPWSQHGSRSRSRAPESARAFRARASSRRTSMCPTPGGPASERARGSTKTGPRGARARAAVVRAGRRPVQCRAAVPDELQHGLRARRPTWSAPGRRRRGRVRACRAILGGRGASSSARMSPASPKARIENCLDDGAEGQRDPLGAPARTVRCNAERVRSRRADLDRARGKPRARDGRQPFSTVETSIDAQLASGGAYWTASDHEDQPRTRTRQMEGAQCRAISNTVMSRLRSAKSFHHAVGSHKNFLGSHKNFFRITKNRGGGQSTKISL